MSSGAHFKSSFFKFLRELAANNDRDWFKANKSRYETLVREPLLRFITDFKPLVAKVSLHIVADPRPLGGSMFRIHRDTRFSKDKSPYKTAASAQFRHKKGRDVHAPGFYLHLEPGRVFAAAGIWRPDSKSLRRIREAMVADPTRWKRILGAKAFRDTFVLEGDSLKRAPKGFDPDHPLIEDLRRKDFIAVRHLTQKAVCSPGFLDEFVKTCRASSDFMAFLARALGLEW
jgi:uncharacterized protein (TIGR02453 family)